MVFARDFAGYWSQKKAHFSQQHYYYSLVQIVYTARIPTTEFVEMNAVMRKCAMVEAAPVPGNTNDNVGIEVAELRADVRHIQADTTEIKAKLRVTNLRFDRFDEKLESLREKTEQGFASLRKELHERIESLRKETGTRFDKIEKRFEKVDERFDKIEKRIDDVKDSLGSAKMWALGLYIGLAGSLFYVLAHGFKWL